jgi:glyoxylase I family protein
MSLVFSHIALNCRDPLATERFYAKHFGFTRARVIPLGAEQIVFLKAGVVYLELFQAKGEPPAPAFEKDGPGYRGIRHFAFQVSDVKAKLAEMGEDAVVTLGPLDFGAFIPGWSTAWVSDPDGNIVEISQGYTDQDNPPQL